MFRGGTGLSYIGSGTRYTEISEPGRVGSVARDTQILTCYCDLLYKPRLDFKPKNPLSIYQAKSFSCHSKILGVSCFHTSKDSQIYKSLARAG